MNKYIKEWLKKSPKELDEIYRKQAAQPGTIPVGKMKGTAIITVPGISFILAFFAKLFIWKGKTFIAEKGSSVLINRILPLGLSFVVALVYKDLSWEDKRTTIVIDYSKTSFVFKSIRDEIREIHPGVYLGKVWIGKNEAIYFALEK